jgi:hypothetical protein
LAKHRPVYLRRKLIFVSKFAVESSLPGCVKAGSLARLG